MTDVILTVNAGSSSIKFSLFKAHMALAPLYHGRISNLLEAPHFTVYDAKKMQIVDCPLPSCGYSFAIHALLDWVEGLDEKITLCAAGHRVVHGGQDYVRPTVITPHVITALESLTPLAPLHQLPSLKAIEALSIAHPSLLQVACFDTAFHCTQDKIARMYALPAALREEGIMRYGFHGLSYEYINSILPDYTGERIAQRVIVAHLGNGASMCALKDGISVASSMGFTALDGLVMGTRAGSIDPGIVLYMMKEKGLSAHDIEALLYHKCGLLGVSGISHDVQQLLESNAPSAQDAIDLFCYRATQEIGALAAVMGGLDILVFTAGIGENCPLIRQKIITSIAWLGIELCTESNRRNSPCISKASSKIGVYVLPTNEELMIANHTAAII